MTLLLTCEHGGNKIPTPLKTRFAKANNILRSHRGWDEYALSIAKVLRRTLKCRLIFSEVSRLVVDANRSADNPAVFSEFTRSLLPNTKRDLIKKYHTPLRSKTFAMINQQLASDQIVHHFSIHTFVPVLNGNVRKNDIGLLFDPTRKSEVRIAKAIRNQLRKSLPSAKVYFNLPYRGTSDGHTTGLRNKFGDSRYTGIEIEVNQRWLSKSGAVESTSRALAESICQALHFVHL